MKNIKFNIHLLIFVLLTPFWVHAQQLDASLSFIESIHDFGSIKEEDGPVEHKFEFTNPGAKPLIITNVKASCGCTTPSWSKEPVLPGAKGFINVAYNPKMRPGSFNKTITISSNGKPSEYKLFIKGVVEPKPQTIEDTHPTKTGVLRMTNNKAYFSKVFNNQTAVRRIEVINTSDKAVKISFGDLPKHISVKAIPEVLEPYKNGEKKGVVEITYNALKKQAWGYETDHFSILQNGKMEGNGRFEVSAIIVEDFSKLTDEERKNAPVLELDARTFTFEPIKTSEEVSHSFTFTNKGKRNLIVRAVKSSCGCTSITKTPKVVQAGESGAIDVTFNGKGRGGRQHISITLITNDPKNPKTILWLKGTVE